jgi:hypothetical protein
VPHFKNAQELVLSPFARRERIEIKNTVILFITSPPYIPIEIFQKWDLKFQNF